jgi:hypothetical protein
MQDENINKTAWRKQPVCKFHIIYQNQSESSPQISRRTGPSAEDHLKQQDKQHRIQIKIKDNIHLNILPYRPKMKQKHTELGLTS